MGVFLFCVILVGSSGFVLGLFVLIVLVVSFSVCGLWGFSVDVLAFEDWVYKDLSWCWLRSGVGVCVWWFICSVRYGCCVVASFCGL